MRRWRAYWAQLLAAGLFIVTLVSGCGDLFAPSSSSSSCGAPTDAGWTPNVSGVSSGNHDSTVSVSTTSTTVNGVLIGIKDPAPASKEVSVSIDMSQDLGTYGSLLIQAETISMPTGYTGSAYPLLVSLNDGTNELINLARAGSGNDCAQLGYYTCVGSTCSLNPSCTITAPSAYGSTKHWSLHQINGGSGQSGMSLNQFPTCNWTGGTGGSLTFPACAFNSNFFTGGKLRTGTYTAKFIVLAERYASVSGSPQAGVKVTVVKKTDSTAGGAIDLNFILVGSSNVNAAHTSKGRQNLDTLAKTIVDYLGVSNVGIKVGAVNAIEYGCDQGGDSFASLNVDAAGGLFVKSSSVVPSSTEGKAINIFLINSITSSGGSGTVVGIDGSLPGPVVNGTPVSGVLVSTFEILASMNASCTAGADTCPVSQRDRNFWILQSATSHELGHYLGLQHTTESDATLHDATPDTPICTNLQGGVLTVSSCLADTNTLSGVKCSDNCTSYSSSSGTFCPNIVECAFNHLMFWTSKNFKEGTGNSDGNLFSANSGVVMNYHPVVR